MGSGFVDPDVDSDDVDADEDESEDVDAGFVSADDDALLAVGFESEHAAAISKAPIATIRKASARRRSCCAFVQTVRTALPQVCRNDTMLAIPAIALPAMAQM